MEFVYLYPSFKHPRFIIHFPKKLSISFPKHQQIIGFPGCEVGHQVWQGRHPRALTTWCQHGPGIHVFFFIRFLGRQIIWINFFWDMLQLGHKRSEPNQLKPAWSDG